jgi:hypothetical protein
LSNLQFRSTLASYLPPWLTARLASGKLRAFKFLYTIAMLADAGAEVAVQGVQARFPGLGPTNALPYIGRDRQMRRGFFETAASYAARLPGWLDYHRGRGNAFTIMQQVRAYVAPFVPLMRIVNQSGTWYTINPDGSTETHQTWPASNWIWDGNAALPTRIWPIIYSDSSPIWAPGPNIGAVNLWNGAIGSPGFTIGSTATPEQVQTIQTILAETKSAGDAAPNIIISFDEHDFPPTAAPFDPNMPNGTWGEDWDPAHLTTTRFSAARYWQGVA